MSLAFTKPPRTTWAKYFYPRKEPYGSLFDMLVTNAAGEYTHKVTNHDLYTFQLLSFMASATLFARFYAVGNLKSTAGRPKPPQRSTLHQQLYEKSTSGTLRRKSGRPHPKDALNDLQ